MWLRRSHTASWCWSGAAPHCGQLSAGSPTAGLSSVSDVKGRDDPETDLTEVAKHSGFFEHLPGEEMIIIITKIISLSYTKTSQIFMRKHLRPGCSQGSRLFRFILTRSSSSWLWLLTLEKLLEVLRSWNLFWNSLRAFTGLVCLRSELLWPVVEVVEVVYHIWYSKLGKTIKIFLNFYPVYQIKLVWMVGGIQPNTATSRWFSFALASTTLSIIIYVLCL